VRAAHCNGGSGMSPSSTVFSLHGRRALTDSAPEGIQCLTRTIWAVSGR
jgi:hypothetical protein